MTANTGYQAVLFDLDGTLLDTAPDMVAALNLLLAESDRAPADYELARLHVSKGALGLIDVGFGKLEEARRMSLRDRYLELYRENLAHQTELFEGMEAVLQHLESLGLAWGIVTNKPGFLTDPLLEELNLHRRSAITVSGDTLAERKPHPQPLLHAAASIGVAPAASLYVGDDERDIQAGNAAGMTTVTALYGFITPDEDPNAWPADHQIKHPADLLTIISTTPGSAS